MKNIFIVAVLLAFGFVSVMAQDPRADVYNSPGSHPMFYYDVLSFKDGDKVRLDLFIQVPYPTLKFVKGDEGFTASYEANIAFYDEKNEKMIDDKTWSETVTSKDFNPTTSRHNFHYSVRSLHLAPGAYSVRASITD
jgi:hypothetical protein